MPKISDKNPLTNKRFEPALHLLLYRNILITRLEDRHCLYPCAVFSLKLALRTAKKERY